MSNTYQKDRRPAQADPLPGEVGVPEQVVVSMAEIAGAAKEGLLALAVGTGLQVMAAMFDEEVTRLCGWDGKHNPARAGYRHGTGAGSVTLGGRRVPVTRPRVRAADGSAELRLPSYDLFSSTEILSQMALEKMLAGLSSRRYGHGLEPAGQAAEARATPASKSAVSRRFVAATETALAELMSRRLDDLDLVAFMVDGVHFGESTCVVALGIGIDGVKHPLAVEEGSTENATLVTDLITGLRERGLDVTKPILAVIDGSKALSRAINDVFDKPLIHRCQAHRSRKDSTCCFSLPVSLSWYGHIGRGPWAARLEVQSAVSTSERAAAAAGAGAGGPAARPRRGACGGAGGRGQRDYSPGRGVRVGGRRGSAAGRPGSQARRGTASRRGSGSGSGARTAGTCRAGRAW